MNPAIEAALNDWRILNSTPNWWAKFESVLFPNDILIVTLEYGIIHSNGFKECALQTKSYHVELDGTVGISA